MHEATNKGKIVSKPSSFVVMVNDSILEQKSGSSEGAAVLVL